MRQITLTLSREPGDYIDLATDVPSKACVLIGKLFLYAILICQTFSQSLGCRILIFIYLPPVATSLFLECCRMSLL